MTTYVTVTVPAAGYAGDDDSLAAAVRDVRADLDLRGYDLDAEWGDDDRDTIVVEIPAYAADDAEAAGYEVSL